MKYLLPLLLCFILVVPFTVSAQSPTPTNCGHNNQMCCPGDQCLVPGDICYDLYTWALGGSFCMSEAQYAVWVRIANNKNDTVDRFCGAIGDYPNIRTAFGCIPTSPKDLVSLLATWTIGLGSGAALLSIFYAGFVMTTAGGDIKKVNTAKTIITSAVIGLVIIVLAVLILNFAGFRLFGLNIFGFGV